MVKSIGIKNVIELNSPLKKSELCVEINICWLSSIIFEIISPNCNACGGCKNASGSSSKIIGFFTEIIAHRIPKTLLIPSPCLSSKENSSNCLDASCGTVDTAEKSVPVLTSSLPKLYILKKIIIIFYLIFNIMCNIIILSKFEKGE